MSYAYSMENETAMTLSPAAQAVLNACRAVPHLRDCPSIAAALRAAADQVVPEFWHEEGDIYAETKHDVRADLLAIAAELEGVK
jgi:hypothetical protein